MYIAQFTILAEQSGLLDEKALAEYYMEGIQANILKDVFRAGPIPKTMEEWYTETSRIELQQWKLKEIEDRRKGITTTAGNYSYNSYHMSKRDPNTMDIDRLMTKEVERHRKERLCFRCHKPGHIGWNCRNTGTNQRQAESKPQDNKKKYRNNMIRKILSALAEEEEQEEQEEPAPKDDNKDDKDKGGKEGKDNQDFWRSGQFWCLIRYLFRLLY